MENKKKALEQIIQGMKQTGQIDTTGLINPNQSFLNQALDARDLTQGALGHEVLKNTDIRIPGPKAKLTQIEDFYNRLLQSTHPEIKADVDLADLTKDNAKGMYYSAPTKDMHWIEMQKDLWRKDPAGAVGTLMHEGGHQYDDLIEGFQGNDLKERIKKAGLLPADAYEAMASGHHKDLIPGKREGGSFGKGALTSLFKNGTFRQVAGALPYVGTAAGVGTALATGDVMAAVPIPGLESSDVGESAASEIQGLKEHDARVNYDNSQARRDALMKVKNGR